MKEIKSIPTQNKQNRRLLLCLALLSLFPKISLLAQQIDFPLAEISIFVPENWNTQKSETRFTSTSPDGLASLYCAIIEPQKSKEALMEAAKVFTSEIEDFTFNNEGSIKEINGLHRFKIEGAGVVNHSKISVSLAFYTTPSQDMIIVASIYSDAYGEIYKNTLLNAEESVRELTKR